ncbi:unnamed protein product, partial [Rotaria magnacalcarata]
MEVSPAIPRFSG